MPRLTSFRAGNVMSAATTVEIRTALRGTLLASSFAQRDAPGTAPSRLNANSMRLVEVMQALVQKN